MKAHHIMTTHPASTGSYLDLTMTGYDGANDECKFEVRSAPNGPAEERVYPYAGVKELFARASEGVLDNFELALTMLFEDDDTWEEQTQDAPTTRIGKSVTVED